jgi:polyisoprenoid-binding protein YceI
MPTSVQTIGPSLATLKVLTGKEGKSAAVGHNLEIEVEDWTAEIELDKEAPGSVSMSLTANSRSLRVLLGTGGMQALDDRAKATIAETINSEILRGGEISFRSTTVDNIAGTSEYRVRGQLNLLGATRPLEFNLTIDGEGRIAAEAVIEQTDFGLKPYSTFFNTLRVKNRVAITLDGHL